MEGVPERCAFVRLLARCASVAHLYLYLYLLFDDSLRPRTSDVARRASDPAQRRVHVPDLVRDPRQLAADAARRLRLRVVEAQGGRAPPGRVHAEAHRRAGAHGRREPGRGRDGGVGEHHRRAPVGRADAVPHRRRGPQLLDGRGDAGDGHVCAVDEDEDTSDIGAD